MPTAAVAGIVTAVVRAVPLLGPPIADGVNKAFSAGPPLQLGQVGASDHSVSGATLAAKVNERLAQIPLLGPLLAQVSKGVNQTLTGTCAVFVTVSQKMEQGAAAIVPGAQPKPEQPKPEQPGPKPETPGPGGGSTPGGQQTGPGTQPGNTSGPLWASGPRAGGLPMPGFADWYSMGRAPFLDYSNLPYASPGFFSSVPWLKYSELAPDFGLPGDKKDDAMEAYQNAGQAQALPSGKSPTKDDAPALIAVLLLSLVTSAAVRTWVLRRAQTV
ncbi:hypothetical protein D5S17_00575 [Pseudonocardiaceae bacterium YIM PH 21723]|nr:hypothetical protein D5S17_00575 [Pseudonocardiaceae bacterium YIM PH 21723]